jgi:hypothetical protein
MEITRSIRRVTAVALASAAGALMLLAGPTSGASAVPAGDSASVFDPTKPGVTITVVGVVVEGVENGCRILVPLNSSGTTGYLLLGGPPTKFEQVYRVTGRPEPGLPTTCQQGTPLHVISAVPL